MHRCLHLARLGGSLTATNPLVGACIVYESRIIGEGYHELYGGPHAEVNALASIAQTDLDKLPYSTLYVNLEPCHHHGHTGPCSLAILKSGIPRVVIGMRDPNPHAQGGADYLRSHGVEVIESIAEESCRAVNQPFLVGINHGRPFITLKWAESSNGYIGSSHQPIKISGSSAHILAHELRVKNQAILVGMNTIRIDNPQLTARLVPGTNPLRIVLSSHVSSAIDYQVMKGVEPLIIDPDYATQYSLSMNGGRVDLDEILKHLYSYHHIGRLLVEGGRDILQSFIDQDLWDVAYRIIANRDIHADIPAPILLSGLRKSFSLGTDQVLFYSRS